MLGSNCIHFFKNKLGWLIGRFMVFNATFNNISVIWRRSVLLVEETGVPAEDQVTDKLKSHNVVSSTPSLGVIRTHNVSGDRH